MKKATLKLQQTAKEFKAMYSMVRNHLAENGVEVLPNDVRIAMGNLVEKKMKLSVDALIREVLEQGGK